jgi:hypothetical protein
MGGAGGRDGGHCGHLVRPVGRRAWGGGCHGGCGGRKMTSCGMGCGNDGSGGTVKGGRPRWRLIE